MSRHLSRLLGAAEPSFSLGLRHLEQSNGNPSADIRLSAQVLQDGRAKIKALGLDPQDTTAEELYQVLQHRFAADNERIEQALRRAGRKDDLLEAVAQTLREAPIPKQVFALKAASLKKLLQRNPPKKAMKQLGYRSFDSMLKHESAAGLLTAAYLAENTAWQRKLLEAYKELRTGDFEVRDVTIMVPTGKRWNELGADMSAQKHHNLVVLKELGATVLLPLPGNEQLRGATTTLLVLGLHALNDIRAASTFLKLAQVRPDFGRVVQQVAGSELYLQARVLDRPVSWELVQRYYDRFKQRFSPAVFEPHIQPDDLSWHNVEQVLSHLEPKLEFWHGTSHLSWLHQDQPVSFNIADVALNYCNHLPFANRVVHYARTSLWHELLLGYMKNDKVEQTVLAELQPALPAETVPV